MRILGREHLETEMTDQVTAPAVELGQRDSFPRVRGKIKARLTFAQFNVLKALISAGEDGLTKDKLDEVSGHTDARKILKRLAQSDPDWDSVIQMALRPGCRYRIQQNT